MNINPKIFREYDIRGIVDKDLTLEFVEYLGRGAGTYFREHGKKRVALGRDARLSSPAYAEAVTRGLLSTGCSVVDIGMVPTPLLYFAVFYKKNEAAVMITGSHNPPEYNGFKMMVGEETLYGETIQQVYRLLKDGKITSDKPGSKSSCDIIPDYENYVVQNIRLGRKLKIVLDAGNGVAGFVAAPIFRKLGCDVTELYCEPDGRFPNHHPDPTLPEAMEDLVKKVLETGADFGVGYDGDGDRIGVVDDRGSLLWGDQLMIVFSRDILPSHPGAAVISEVKASKLLYEEIKRLGGRPIMWKTGHSLIKKKIKEEKAILAGEMSGHIFFADRYFGFDDAIYASARLAEIVSRSEKKLSALLADLPKTYYTPEIRVYASDEVKFKIVDEVKKVLEKKYPVNAIDGIRVSYPSGWALVRASNTQAALVLRYEADTPEDLEAIQKEVKAALERAIKELGNS
ncbi:MAG: phosphoglucomutase/phosphomannomutase alpha/beta/alpha domain [Candidatus Aminicenantes bacterium]|nr:phosphoglucomutase/phosphomannomutase alpha/beta/alpha domain [Candidatus Aminicenantes bacterium]